MVKLSYKYDKRDVYTMNPIGGDHTHQVFAPSGDSALIHVQQNLALYNFNEPSIPNNTKLYTYL